MAEVDEIDVNDYKFRVVTLLTAKERIILENLAWKSGRSMSGYLRYLLIEDIEAHSDQLLNAGDYTADDVGAGRLSL